MWHRIVALLALAVLINYVDRGNLAVAAPILTRELALTNSQLGVLLSASFWTYAPAQILGGWLSDRFDTRVSTEFLRERQSAALPGESHRVLASADPDRHSIGGFPSVMSPTAVRTCS